MRTHTKDSQKTVTPAAALQFLKEGNQRFVNNLKFNRNLLQQVNETREGQWPFAVVLSCIDSRTSAELIFDQGLGDIFSIRIAGNVLNDDILGSMEFACKIAGSKLIVVLGHTKCGAVKGACAHVEMGNLTGLLDKIQPAIHAAAEQTNNAIDSPEFVEEVAEKNVRYQMNEILKKSPILREMIADNKIGLTGAMYSVETGQVNFIYERVNAVMESEFFL